MSTHDTPATPPPDAPDGPSVAEAPPHKQTTAKPAHPRQDRLPPYRVILHNDDVNDMLNVVRTICELTPHNREKAVEVMLRAHTRGRALLLVTHKERAELYVEQFRARKLTVTIRRDE